MDWQANQYTAPAGVAAGLALGLGALAWRRRPSSGASEFALFALAVAVWCFANAVEFARSDLDGKVFWTKVEYIGVVSVPVLWLACTTAYARMGRGLSRGQLAVLSLVPLVTLALVWTNEKHHMIWTRVEVRVDGSTYLWSATYGPWFWVHAAYSYLLLAAASWLVIRLLRQLSVNIHGQAVLLLIGMASPWAANLVYITRLSPLADVDLTPFGFAIGGVAVTGAFFSFRLFDIVPIAREALLRSLSDAVIVLDTSDQVVEANPAAERLIGRSALEQLGRPAADRSGIWTQLLSDLTEAGEAITARAIADGERVRYFDERRAKLRGPSGRQVGWLVVLRDVTDRVEAEANRVQLAREQSARTAAEAAAAERAAGEERLRLALKAGGLGTWDWDVRTNCFSGSPETTTLFDISLDDADVVASRVLARVNAADRRRVLRQFASILRGAATDLVLEFRTVSTGPPLRWLSALGRVVRDSEGHAIGLSGMIRDITDGKEAEQRRELMARAEQLRILGQMAGGIAHDLNQFLALVSGHAELARHELAHVEPDQMLVAEQLEVIVKAAQEGGQSINRLLAFARSGNTRETQTLDVADLLHEVARLTGPRWRDAAQAEARPISLTVEAPAGITISGDGAALREALTNLVFNAVDALPTGGSIRLEGGRIGDQAVIAVQDTGTGMTSDVRARAMEPFFTTKGQRGTGLGLAQVVAAVHQHAGEIELESTPGEGTTVLIRLQTTSPTVADVQPLPAPDVVAAELSLRILAVDDEDGLARMMAQLLSSVGHKVATACSAEDALEYLAHDPCQLVITDLGMGTGMNGWELAEQVRRRWPDTRVVLATGWGADIDPAEAQLRGIDAVVAKPYRLQELRQVVANVARSIGNH